jgi:hypothetical protein
MFFTCIEGLTGGPEGGHKTPSIGRAEKILKDYKSAIEFGYDLSQRYNKGPKNDVIFNVVRRQFCTSAAAKALAFHKNSKNIKSIKGRIEYFFDLVCGLAKEENPCLENSAAVTFRNRLLTRLKVDIDDGKKKLRATSDELFDLFLYAQMCIDRFLKHESVLAHEKPSVDCFMLEEQIARLNEKMGKKEVGADKTEDKAVKKNKFKGK